MSTSSGRAEPVGATYQVKTPGGTTVLHDIGGEEGAGLLVLCHATGFCARAYDRLAAELVGSFHVVGPDFRGHGETGAGAGESFDWRALAEDLVAVCDFARDELASGGSLVAFGHSMGGALILQADRQRPGLIERAYLYEPIVLPEEAEVGPSPGLVEAARRRRATFSSKAEAYLRYGSRPPLDRLEAGVLADYVEHGFVELESGAVSLRCSPADEAATYAADGKPTLGEIGGVTAAITVAAGGDGSDGSGPAGWAPGVARAIETARFEAHENLGHFGPLEAPRRIGAAVRGALIPQPGGSSRRP